MIGGPYTYSEDSALLGSFLLSVPGSGSFLEIGVGRGGNLLRIAGKNNFDVIVGTDIMDLGSLRKEMPKSVDLIQSDRATCFRPASFDLIAFNPPYVPSSKIEDVTTDGGAGGIIVPLLFLSSALGAIKLDGRIVFVLSSEDSFMELEHFCEEKNLELRKLEERPLFFERLFVFLVTRSKENGSVCANNREELRG